MPITALQIASKLSVSEAEILSLLQEQGIAVFDVNSPLSASDLGKLNDAIQREKSADSVPSSPNSPKLDFAKKSFEHYFSNYKIFIDTCSLLCDTAELFWKNAEEMMEKTNTKIIIPTRVLEELTKHKGNTDNADLAKRADTALMTVQRLRNDGFIEVRGEDDDDFADQVFLSVFMKFRMKHNLLLITQDTKLANDILSSIKQSGSVKGVKKIEAKRISNSGFLSGFQFNKGNLNPTNQADQKVKVENEEPDTKKYKKFQLTKSITNVPDDKLPLPRVLSEGDFLFAKYTGKEEKIKLLKLVATGGEGAIYTTDSQYVAKIYKAEKLNRRKYEKIKLMLTNDISCEGICYPVASLHSSMDYSTGFVGYLMPKAQGREIQKSLFIKQLFMNNFPKWKKRDTVELCVSILEKIKFLHDRNIVMGDINPANILVVSPTSVYFVDTDSYQIEGFPCPVGMINYTAPEIQRKKFDTFLRSFGNEYFAVATLLFMIMLPGKPPYSQQGGEDQMDNILQMDFSYPFGDMTNKKTPQGPWRFIWSHLPYDIKGTFYNTFRKDGQNSEENLRVSTDMWLGKFKNYLRLLDSGKLGEQDNMSEELFPTRFKKNPKVNYMTCSICKQEVADDRIENGMCKECLFHKGEVYGCSECGKELLHTNYQKYIKKEQRFDKCPECFERANRTYETRTCVDCGDNFTITNREYQFFSSKGFELPKRCEDCRKIKQSQPQSYTPQNYTNYTKNKNDEIFTSRRCVDCGTYFDMTNGEYQHFSSHGLDLPKRCKTCRKNKQSYTPNYEKSSKPKKGFCFITTAVCDYFQKPDDCYELTLLRSYRDNWLNFQQGGRDVISDYYAIAPAMVVQLSESPIKDLIYTELWEQYIEPCIKYIEGGKFDTCFKKYTSMIEYLKQILGPFQIGGE